MCNIRNTGIKKHSLSRNSLKFFSTKHTSVPNKYNASKSSFINNMNTNKNNEKYYNSNYDSYINKKNENENKILNYSREHINEKSSENKNNKYFIKNRMLNKNFQNEINSKKNKENHNQKNKSMILNREIDDWHRKLRSSLPKQNKNNTGYPRIKLNIFLDQINK